MSLNPLAQVKDYESMLNRIFICTAIISCVFFAVLRQNWPGFDNAMKLLDFDVEFGPIKSVKLGYVVPGVVFAFIARMFRMHDRASDLLRIRENFDIHYILEPLAERSGSQLGRLNIQQLRDGRNALMKKTFYRYASSTDPVIDKHLIYQALDWWSFYWVVVEAIIVIVAIGAIHLAIGSYGTGIVMCASSVVLLLPLQFFYRQCTRYASNEVDDILSDATRKVEVRKAFDAL